MSTLENSINTVNDYINNIVWGVPAIVCIIAVGLFLSARLGFFQITKIPTIWRNTIKKLLVKTDDKNKFSTAEAALVSLGEVVGSGNIAGVATAVVAGGPGAIVWMWIAAILGMATKFSEIVLGIMYKQKNPDGSIKGGPMYYLNEGVGSKFLAGLYALLCMMSYIIIVAMVDTNTIVDVVTTKFESVPNYAVAAVLIVIVGIVTFGGIKKLGGFSGWFVPVMGVLYIFMGILVILAHPGMAGKAFGTIVGAAFKPQAAAGGFAGATVAQIMRYGFARGIYSNEAGLGTSAFPHAAADTDHPARQALWAPVEICIDTLIVNTITGLVVVMAGMWTSGSDGAGLAMESFGKLIPGVGEVLIFIAAIMFSMSCLTSASYVCEQAAEFLFGEGSKKAIKFLWLAFIAIGAMTSLELVWNLADTINGLMLIPNLIGLVILSKKVVDAKKDFFAKEEKKGEKTA